VEQFIMGHAYDEYLVLAQKSGMTVDSGATNHTTPHPGHIFSPKPPSLAHPSSIIVGNGSVLSVTSVGDSVLFGPFYLNDVLLAPNLV
jgi:hypothetical protein